jgi:hypothetical protein
MKSFLIISLISILYFVASAQSLKVVNRSKHALTGDQFALKIADTSIVLEDREKLIFGEFKAGNLPKSFKRFHLVEINKVILGKNYRLLVEVTANYLGIGNDENYFYIPTTPMLAQKIATSVNCILPTRLLVDEIYKQANIKLEPKPIPPSKQMTMVSQFKIHSDTVNAQVHATNHTRKYRELIAGHKKDIIISNKIYGQSSPRVVIYGWHKLDGKAIQPVYNKHTNTWADYSHGIRLVHRKAKLNGKEVDLLSVLKHPTFHQLISDEGVIENAEYPLK